jgi:hypothetical protein
MMMQRQLALGRLARSAIVLLMASLPCLTWASSATANNIGAWFAGNSAGETTGYGGDSGFYIPTVSAASGEIVLNRTAEQNSNKAANTGIFQAGTYTSGEKIHLDLCSSTSLGEEQIFTEYRQSGAGYSYICHLYGAVFGVQTCVFNLGLSSGGEWYAAGGCPSSPNLLNLKLNWGIGYDYVGGEINNAGNSLANGSNTSTEYDPAGQEWVVWRGANRTSPEAPPWNWCVYPTKEWHQAFGDYDFPISHPSSNHFCS